MYSFSFLLSLPSQLKKYHLQNKLRNRKWSKCRKYCTQALSLWFNVSVDNRNLSWWINISVFWRCRQRCVFAVRQAGWEDVLPHCCCTWELHHAVSIHGGSICHRAAEGTNTHTHYKCAVCLLFASICIRRLIWQKVLQSSDRAVKSQTATITDSHSVIQSQYSSWSQPISHPLWLSTDVSDAQTCTYMYGRVRRISADPFILPSLSGSSLAECQRHSQWRWEEETGKHFHLPNCRSSQISVNRSRITVTPCAGEKL